MRVRFHRRSFRTKKERRQAKASSDDESDLRIGRFFKRALGGVVKRVFGKKPLKGLMQLGGILMGGVPGLLMSVGSGFMKGRGGLIGKVAPYLSLAKGLGFGGLLKPGKGGDVGDFVRRLGKRTGLYSGPIGAQHTASFAPIMGEGVKKGVKLSTILKGGKDEAIFSDIMERFGKEKGTKLINQTLKGLQKGKWGGFIKGADTASLGEGDGYQQVSNGRSDSGTRFSGRRPDGEVVGSDVLHGEVSGAPISLSTDPTTVARELQNATAAQKPGIFKRFFDFLGSDQFASLAKIAGTAASTAALVRSYSRADALGKQGAAFSNTAVQEGLDLWKRTMNASSQSDQLRVAMQNDLGASFGGILTPKSRRG